MPFVVIGVLLLIARWREFGPFAEMSWWWTAVPFGLAILWWEFADASGWTKRRAMDKMEQRKVDRRDKQMEALGMKVAGKRRDSLVTKHAEAKARQVSADPTHAGRDATTKPLPPAEPPRREPRL